jgi:3',5'-cyclic AMP phosphodiesterase CpdA
VDIRTLRAVPWGATILGWLGVLAFGATLLVGPPGAGPVPGVRNADLHDLPADDAEPWSVVLLSDIQNGAAYLPELLRRAESWHPRAIIITGDLAADPPLAQVPVWYLRRHPPSAPMFIVPGNHDVWRRANRTLGEREFIQWYGGTTFEVSIGRTLLLGLDNSTGPVVGRDLDAVRARLETAHARRERTLLFLHRNLLPFDHPFSTAEELHRDLLNLIQEHEVPYVICGHLHRSLEDSRGSTTFVALPASGNLGPSDPRGKPVAYVVLRWTGRSFELQREEFPRQRLTELKGSLVVFTLAKLLPIFASAFGPVIAGACTFAAIAGTATLVKRRKPVPIAATS